MKGLPLSRLYYEEYGRPLIREKFSDYEGRIAVGLAGMGSECFGFDDEISADHDYGPSFCLWLTQGDFDAIGPTLQAEYDRLPGTFLGIGPRQASGQGNGRVGVMTVTGFYRMFVGDYQPPRDPLDWLRLPEQYLACAVNGQVFRDDLGEFTAIRQALLSYYPEDVHRKKIAARAAAMAQSGQYNYSRCMRRGETVAAHIALGKFLEAAAAMGHLLCRRYMPFYKWCFRSMEQLPLPPQFADGMRRLAGCRLAPELWPQDDKLKYALELNLQDEPVQLIEDICACVAGLLRKQGLSESQSDFLQEHAESVMQGVQDPRIQKIFISEG